MTDFSPPVRERFGVPDGIQRIRWGAVSSALQLLHLLEQPGPNHRFTSPVDSPIEIRPVPGQSELQRFEVNCGSSFLLEHRQWFTGRVVHFQRTYDPPGLGGIGRRSHFRIHGPEFLEEIQHSAPIHPLLEHAAEFFVRTRTFEETVDQRPNIESGPADDYRGPPAGHDLSDDAAGLPSKLPGAELLVRQEVIHKVVRDSLPQRRIRLRRSDVKVPVHLTGVSRNDFSPQSTSQVDRNLCFAGSSGSDEHQHVGLRSNRR